MDFFINEQQLKLILQEQDKSKMSGYMKQLHSFVADLVGKVSKVYGINLRMLLTWGASLGGLLKPLDIWLKTGNFNLDDNERALILVGVGMSLFFDTKPAMEKLLKKIKELKLKRTYDASLKKTSELRDVFLDFMGSLNLSMGTLLDVVAYSFLIPILIDIQQLAVNSKDSKETIMLIVSRLLASGVVVVSSQTLTTIVKKLLNRFK